MVGVKDEDVLYRKGFNYLNTIDFYQNNPEIIGEVFKLIKGDKQ